MNHFNAIDRLRARTASIRHADAGCARGVSFNNQFIRDGIIIIQRGIQMKMTAISLIVPVYHKLITGIFTFASGPDIAAVRQIAAYGKADR